jgi:acetyltransferase-like isoleucine patch superfamily enzyme
VESIALPSDSHRYAVAVPVRSRLRRLPWELRYIHAERAASEARRLALLATNTHADVRIPKTVRLGPGFRLYMPQGGTFIVHPGCDFRRDFVCEISGGGRVEIGPGTVFTSSTLIQITTSLTIGARAALGQATLIVDGNHRWRDPDVQMLDQGYDFTPIEIGDGAIVFTKSTIFASVGERAVVGAHSLVNKPVPAYCFASGTPARVREYFGHPENRPPDLVVP